MFFLTYSYSIFVFFDCIFLHCLDFFNLDLAIALKTERPIPHFAFGTGFENFTALFKSCGPRYSLYDFGMCHQETSKSEICLLVVEKSVNNEKSIFCTKFSKSFILSFLFLGQIYHLHP